MESLPFEEGGILKMETKEILDDIVVYIKENIGGRLTVGELAAAVYISPAQLQRLFRVEFHMTVAEYVRLCKLKKHSFFYAKQTAKYVISHMMSALNMNLLLYEALNGYMA